MAGRLPAAVRYFGAWIMPGVNRGFPDKVTKALARYRADAQAQGLIDRSGRTGVRDEGAGHVGHAYAPARYEPPAAVPVHAYEAAAEVSDIAGGVRRRIGYRWLLVLLVLPVLGWLANLPVGKELTFAAVLTAYGDVVSVTSPVDGVVRRISIPSDRRVVQGQPLIEIDPEIPPGLVKLQHERVALALREAGLRARLAGERVLTYPSDLADAYPTVDIPPLLAIERERLVDRIREDAQHLQPTQRAIDAAMSERAEVRAEKKAIESRLDKIRRQVGAAASLKKQNVIYEDGVYTEQLLRTLKRTRSDIQQELTALGQDEERIDERLRELNNELTERQQQYQAGLRQQLEKHRSATDAVLAQLEELEAQVAVVKLNAMATGLFKPNPALQLGGHVDRGDAIGAVLVPSDQGIVESQVSAQESEAIRVGQPVRVTLQHLKQDTRLRLHGRVVSLVSDASDGGPGGGLHRVRIEIDVPLHANHPASELSAGMPGSITIVTGGEPIWRHTWRMVNIAGVNGFIDFDQG